MQNPAVRFKKEDGTDYPDWEEKTIGDIFSPINDKNHPKEIVLSIMQGEGTVKRDESNRNIFYKKENLSSYKFTQKNDFIVHMRSFEGGLEINNINGIVSPAYTVLRNKIEIAPLFYKDYFRSYRFIAGKLQRIIEGIRDGKSLNMKDFYLLKIPYPCFLEQQKIADFFSNVDEIILATEKELEDYELQKKDVMQKIFSQEVRFTADDGTAYPDWEEKKVGEVFVFINGIGHEQDVVDNGKYIIVNSKFISTDGKIKKYSNAQILPLKKHDITMVMSDLPNGKALAKCFLIKENDKYTLNQRICCLRSKENSVFMANQLNRNKYYLKFDDGYQQTNLKKSEILDCPVLLPCIEEQKKIAAFFSAFDELIDETRQELECWKQIKKGLLQQMFV